MLGKRLFSRLLAVVLLAFVSAPAFAVDDALLMGARECTRHFPRQERIQGIPEHLLSAISITESGRWHDGLGMKLPWPWTINAEGKGQMFPSKAEAVAAVRRLRAQGVKSIDVGCMQVNLLHHPNAFRSLEEAFDPEANVGYAARFLRGNYSETNSWRTAVANYHSRTPSLGERYTGFVRASWNQLKTRLTSTPDAKALARYQRYLVKQPELAKGTAARAATASASVEPTPVVSAKQEQYLRPVSSSAKRARAKIVVIDAQDTHTPPPAASPGAVRVIRPQVRDEASNAKSLDISLRGKDALVTETRPVKAELPPVMVKVRGVGENAVQPNVRASTSGDGKTRFVFAQ